MTNVKTRDESGSSITERTGGDLTSDAVFGSRENRSRNWCQFRFSSENPDRHQYAPQEVHNDARSG